MPVEIQTEVIVGTPAVSPVGVSLPNAGEVPIDVTLLNRTLQVLELTGNVDLSAINILPGRSVTIRILETENVLRSISFDSDWVFYGTQPPGTLQNSSLILTLLSFGESANDIVASVITSA